MRRRFRAALGAWLLRTARSAFARLLCGRRRRPRPGSDGERAARSAATETSCGGEGRVVWVTMAEPPGEAGSVPAPAPKPLRRLAARGVAVTARVTEWRPLAEAPHGERWIHVRREDDR